jgi:hypothetical protein
MEAAPSVLVQFAKSISFTPRFSAVKLESKLTGKPFKRFPLQELSLTTGLKPGVNERVQMLQTASLHRY